MSTQSALGGTWVASRRRTKTRSRKRRAAVPTRWADPVAAIDGFVTDPIARVPGPNTGIPLPRYRPRSIPRMMFRFLFRTVLVLLALAVVAGAGAALPYLESQKEARRADAAEARAAATAATLTTTQATSQTRAGRIVTMRNRIALLETRYAALQAAKVRTVVETKTVTEEVIRWVPNGTDVAVELTGFEGIVGIHDVQITRSYGFTDIVGIAVNQSDQTLSYAQLGCTFLDKDGNVMANAMTNKQGWAPGQSWGFTCSAQVDATGGILRVDEMS